MGGNPAVGALRFVGVEQPDRWGNMAGGDSVFRTRSTYLGATKSGRCPYKLILEYNSNICRA